MSTTYSLRCNQCREGVWIGQSQMKQETWSLYSGNPDKMEKLAAFLWKHRYHPLEFSNDTGWEAYKFSGETTWHLPNVAQRVARILGIEAEKVEVALVAALPPWLQPVTGEDVS